MSMSMYKCIYVYAHIHIYIYTCICICKCICMCVHVHVYADADAYAYLYAVYTGRHVYMHVYSFTIYIEVMYVGANVMVLKHCPPWKCPTYLLLAGVAVFMTALQCAPGVWGSVAFVKQPNRSIRFVLIPYTLRLAHGP